MKTIQDIDIQHMFPDAVYKRGLQYYNRSLVNNLIYDRNYNIWSAVVKGTEDYFVEINMADETEGSIEVSCDCPAFDTFGPCKHIAAVMLELKNNSSNNPATLSRDYNVTDWLMNSIASLAEYEPADEITFQKIPLQINYSCRWEYEKNLLLELKVGESRPLIVKNVKDFLEDVFTGNEHYFTKTFTYNPDIHYFKEQDLEILEKLHAILNNEKVYFDRAIYRFTDAPDRSVIIPPLTAKELLEKLSERDFTVKAADGNYQDITVTEGELPFHFSLTETDAGELALRMVDAQSITYFKQYGLLFSDGSFYFPEDEQLPIIEHITMAASASRQLPVPNEKKDDFISQVVPSLEKIGNVDISERIANDIIQLPLTAKLYLELQDNQIAGKLSYHYGNYEIDPFNGREQDGDGILIRDVKKEQQIMNLIEHANFHYNGRELYIEIDEETLYEFLFKVMPVLDKYLELYMTDEIRQFFIDQQPSPSTSVQLESSSNLLDIGFNIDGVNDEEINQVLSAVMEKKRYYRLNDGAFLSLESEAFESMQQLFDDLDINQGDLENGNVQMPVYRGTQVDELIDMPKQYDPAFRQLLSQLQSPEEQVYPLPDNLNADLRNYQLTGYQWFKSLSHYHLGGILADDMGLGKTLQSIAYILSEPSDTPHLIIAPSSVLYNWKNEFAKFAPDLRVTIMAGTPAERADMIEENSDKDVWITSYATLRQDIEHYQDKSFQTLILDEAQYIKNYATKTSRAIRQLKAGRRFALSGTPIENSINELWAIFQVVLPGLMPSQRKFKQLENEKIASLTRPFILRRVKQDVLKELPEKIETVHVSELTKDQKDLYIGYWRQLQQEAAQSMKERGFQQNRMKILAGLTRLRQICCHPSVFLENYEGESGKLNQLMDTVKNAAANGKRMLIFSQFTSMHEIIIGKLDELGIDYFYLHGQTGSEERVKMSERFNNGEKSVFLVSLKAGGTGLNLTGADTVILYDLWWNPAVEDQATGRAHRFGQKNVVQVIRLITEGTIEEKIYELQQKKRELIDEVIQPGEAMLSSLSEEDVRELLNL
ncbi:Superfamily II DNA or RNA helicase, SNF2 family [Lentibacillus persicus]|uniref:Superfamily II DNA or RNA helicase, SNF2 family n=1 Tax=Lentibacillus persicus TaxID=640948 RepID=A0A1I1U5H6_9BACI|nr:DEAD/DEAH box helicase [Lentibacillus persicus]SFD65945.1 Superfamily II DNA or RNA helicase, SNF2 family [Lentibacillus persicus]